jgi:hypothetical protein
MAHYRIYALDVEGTIASGLDVQADSDDEACFKASLAFGGDAAAEVWLGTKCVRRIAARPK